MQIHIVDGFELPSFQPDTVAEACDIVRNHPAIYPIGGGTALDYGRPPSTPGVALQTTRWNRVVDYPARDLTITVQAGLTWEALTTVLDTEGQTLPVDMPNPAQATVGGAVATNWCGVRRLMHGTLRDYLLGITFISDAGEVIRAGGRVVKNVAGYDFMKLMTGALGTLGVLTELTFKVKPKPETYAAMIFDLGAAALAPTLDRLHESNARPAWVQLRSTPGGWSLACGFEEKEETVRWQLGTLQAELATAPIRELQLLDSEATCALLRNIRNESAITSRACFKLNLPPSEVAPAALTIQNDCPDATIVAHALSGILFVQLPPEADVALAQRIQRTLAALTRQGSSNAVVVRCPTAWKSSLDVWGRDTGDRRVMRAIQQALDPAGKLNPGRFI